jgi:hypothetical protein
MQAKVFVVLGVNLLQCARISVASYWLENELYLPIWLVRITFQKNFQNNRLLINIINDL